MSLTFWKAIITVQAIGISTMIVTTATVGLISASPARASRAARVRPRFL